MKKLLFFICLISYVSFGNITAQKKGKNDCDRIKLTVDQFTGNKTYSSPTNNMKPFNSIWMPQIILFKIIQTGGKMGYFMSFSISGSTYIEGKEYNNNCIVLFEDGKRIEKTTEVTITKYTGYSTSYYYRTTLPLDSSDLELIKSSKMKAIRLSEFDMDKINTPEFYMFYLNCLIEKK